jgi:hypothetical protein
MRFRFNVVSVRPPFCSRISSPFPRPRFASDPRPAKAPAPPSAPAPDRLEIHPAESHRRPHTPAPRGSPAPYRQAQVPDCGLRLRRFRSGPAPPHEACSDRSRRKTFTRPARTGASPEAAEIRSSSRWCKRKWIDTRTPLRPARSRPARHTPSPTPKPADGAAFPCHQRRFNGVRRSLLIHAAHLHFANHRQRHRARRGHPHRRMKLRRVKLAHLQRIAGPDGSRHGLPTAPRPAATRPPALPRLFQTAGASFGLGSVLVSCVCGNWPRPSASLTCSASAPARCAAAPARTTTSQRRHRAFPVRTPSDSIMSAPPTASHSTRKERNRHIERQIRRNRLHRLPRKVHHRDAGTVDARRQPRLLHLLLSTRI